MYVCIYTLIMYIFINKRKAGYMAGFGGKKEKGKGCNCSRTSKIKEIIRIRKLFPHASKNSPTHSPHT